MGHRFQDRSQGSLGGRFLRTCLLVGGMVMASPAIASPMPANRIAATPPVNHLDSLGAAIDSTVLGHGPSYGQRHQRGTGRREILA